jgi:hypothetical protein
MTHWILLLLTILSGYIAYDSFRWGNALKDVPFSAIASMWKGGLSHLPLSEQNKIKDRYASSVFGVVQFQLIFLAVTIGLAIATVRAFLE